MMLLHLLIEYFGMHSKNSTQSLALTPYNNMINECCQ